ncbi:hypothetical protein Taro_023812, partial [Colocasia esculenta]|nr:hypothetical protein [Colocasia esculenta]
RGATIMAACFMLPLARGVAVVVASKQFKIRGDERWHLPNAKNTYMYVLWAGRTSLQVEDSIYFDYSNGSTLLVDKRGYYHCNTTNVTTAFHDGKIVFNLDKLNLLYFISGEPRHCKNGQCLIIHVRSLAPSHHQPSPPPCRRLPSSPPSQSSLYRA